VLHEPGQSLEQPCPGLARAGVRRLDAGEEGDTLRTEPGRYLDGPPEVCDARVGVGVHERGPVLDVRVEEEPRARLDDHAHPQRVEPPAEVVDESVCPRRERVEVRVPEGQRDRAVALGVQDVERRTERVVREAVGAVAEDERHLGRSR
jgi:hypothetical protein